MVERAVLFITTHGTVKLNKRKLPIIKTPLKIKKLDGVKLGVCNFYQPGTPNIIQNIMNDLKLQEPEDSAEFIKEKLVNFETRKEMVNTRGGLYLPVMMKEWSNQRDPEYDPDVVQFVRYFDDRYQIHEYEKNSDIIDKTYTVYKSESNLPKFENRVMLYLDGYIIDILRTWKVKGVYDTLALAAKRNKGTQISITLKQIFGFNELVIADLTCSVFTDNKGNELDMNRRDLRYLSRTRDNIIDGIDEEPPEEIEKSFEFETASKGANKQSKKKKKKEKKKKKKVGTKKRWRRLKK